MTIEEAIQRARQLGGKAPKSKPIAKDDYISMTYEELKEKETSASDWLKANKYHPKFKEALKKYQVIVKYMNLRS